MVYLVRLALVDSTQFRLIYSAGAEPEKGWIWLALAATALVIGGVRLWGAGGVSALFESDSSEAVGGAILVMLGIVGAGWIFLTGIAPDSQLRDALRANQCEVRDGVITKFVPGDLGDHTSESWVLRMVNGEETFTYSPSIAAPGYNLTTAHGGVLREGLRIRLSDCHGRIGRLEVAISGS